MPPSRPPHNWAAWAWQALAVGLLAWGLWLLTRNTLANMEARGIQSGFDFLRQRAGFDIGEGLLPFDAADSYGQAFVAGLANTLKVALPAIVAATLLGTALGIARQTPSLLLRGVASALVELFRNLPLLLQLLMWYLLLITTLPAMDAPWQMGPLALNKAGLHLALARQSCSLSPEFMALGWGLSLYTAAFIAEIVRAGLGAVPVDQHDAAWALGLSRSQALRHVVLPQALKVAVPPLTNQWLNLTKNSSLAVAIGYPDLVSVANTTINQTGRALECLVVVMAVYLCTSLLTAWLMQRVNARAMRGNR